MKMLYQTKAVAHGGRDGYVKSEDGNLNVNLAVPKSLGGSGKEGATNPEQLFAAGYSACFESAVRHVARSKKIVIQDLSVEAEVGLIPAETGFALVVSLAAIFSNLEYGICDELVQKAHQVCPYSNALRNNVEVKISVKTTSRLQEEEN
ncbi:MAG: organic hydroperoxide resistance protein [Bdellovibrio sp.]